MGLIALEGMKFYAYHGVYDEERVVGTNFIVDVYIDSSFAAASQTDRIDKTINYETVFLICQAEMRKPTKLIETIADRIILNLKYQFNTIQNCRVKIRKKNPILGGKVDQAYVESSESFISKCGRCGRGMICYGDETCWCQDLQIHPKTQESLREQFRGCLCKSCLSFYAG